MSPPLREEYTLITGRAPYLLHLAAGDTPTRVVDAQGRVVCILPDPILERTYGDEIASALNRIAETVASWGATP